MKAQPIRSGSNSPPSSRRKFLAGAAGTAAIASGLPDDTFGQSAADLAVMAPLASKIYNIVTAKFKGENLHPVDFGDQWICFAAPGLAVDRGQLNFGNLYTPAEENANAVFSKLVNSIPSAAGPWAPTTVKVWDRYESAITWVDLAAGQLPDQEKTTLGKIEKFLITTNGENSLPSHRAKIYKASEAKYRQTLMCWNQVVHDANRADATDLQRRTASLNAPIFLHNCEQAARAWQAEGYKRMIEEARSVVANLTGMAPRTVYERLKENFRASKRTGPGDEAFYPSFCYPDDCLSSQNDDRWTEFTFSKDSSDLQQSARQISHAINGLWSTSRSGIGSGESSRMPGESNGLEVTAELLHLPIQRSWMESSVFGNRNWKWPAGSLSEPISNGGTPPSGSMPLIPTGVLLARNLELRMNLNSATNRSAVSRIKSSASGGWGPFRIAGHHSQPNQGSGHQATFTDSKITVAGAQIIGMVCEVVPAPSPNPDPGLNWGA